MINSLHASQTAQPASDKLVCSCNVLYTSKHISWLEKEIHSSSLLINANLKYTRTAHL